MTFGITVSFRYDTPSIGSVLISLACYEEHSLWSDLIALSLRLGVNSLHVASHGIASPVRILRFELGGDGLRGVIGGLSLSLLCEGAVAEIGEEGALLRDQGGVAEGAVVGDDQFWVQGDELVEIGDPAFCAGFVVGEVGDQLVHGEVAGEQDAVWLDENQFVALGVGGAQPEEARGDSAEVEVQFPVEENVWRPQVDVLEEAFVLLGHVAEAVDHFGAEFIHFLLLDGGADQDGVGREGLQACGVLWMEMRGGEVKDRGFGKGLHDAHDRCAVGGAQAGVNHQGGAGADDDADVGEADEDVDVVGNFFQRGFADQGLDILGVGGRWQSEGCGKNERNCKS
jgi:hypothetical protein